MGEWLVKDRTAHIRIANCNGKLWGTISWAEKPGTDENNPDPTKRSRSVLGMPILLGMQADIDSRAKWKGDIYNADNGKTYHGSITLASIDTLHVEGCFWSILCGGENWIRLTSDPSVSACKMLPTQP